MLVSTKNQKLVLHSRNPARITTLIPTAKQFEYKGAQLIAVPHRYDEVKVLRNIGIRAPSPIHYYYDWPRMPQIKAPFKAQQITAGFLSLTTRSYVLSDTGTGKTLAALWAYDYLRSFKLANKLLVVAPLSTLERAWGDEIFRNFPHLTFAVLHGTKEKRLKLLANDFDIYIINPDGLKILAPALASRDDIDVVILDELAVYRNAGTGLWKSANAVVNRQCRRRVWAMTATPIPNAPSDAWAQCRLVTPDSVPRSYRRFRDMTMRQVSPYRWEARPGGVDTVYAAMSPSVRFSREQCVDLPPQLYQTHSCEFTPEQATAYTQMVNQLKVELVTARLQGAPVIALNDAIKVSKLLQIASGILYGHNGEAHALPVLPRLKLVESIVAQAAGKAIVFVPFRAALRQVVAHLSKHWSIGVVDGSVSSAARNKVFQEFQNGHEMRVLVANPDAISHGLTLTAASTIVWFGPTHSNETYEQANGRICRPGQKRNTFIVHIEGCLAERKVFERLRNRQSVQGLLLDLIGDED